MKALVCWAGCSWLVAFALTCLLLFEQTVAASYTYPSSDQIVVASTRNYSTASSAVGFTLDLNSFRGRAYDACGNVRQLVDFRNAEGFVETWIFVHGNQIDATMAVDRGLRAYRNLRATSANRGPIRFIIWSWPSERTKNRISDARLKSKRTDAEMFYFGSFLSQIARQGPIGIIGYSFGARVVSGGLHLSEGGTLCGKYLPTACSPVCPYRVAFLAAAVENDGLCGSGRYRNALNHVSHLLLQNNSRDKALRFFWVIGRNRPKALGRTSMKFAPRHVHVRQYDWADAIGKDHSVWNYLERPIILRRVIETISR